jgi:RHS repeat-associated protein
MLTNAAKATVWSAIYEPFGRVHSVTGTVTQNLGLPGQWFQLEHGLAYNWHRHYDATTGRYTTADPLGFVDGPSVFAYAGSAPHLATDPSGQFAWGVLFAALNIGSQLYENGGDWRCIDIRQVGLSMLGGGLFGAYGKGAFMAKSSGSHTWGATKHWMKNEGLHKIKPGQHRHHWLFEQNQGIGKNVQDRIKNQPWNINPISAELNNRLARYPALAFLGGPAWAGEVLVGSGLIAGGGNAYRCR